MRILLTGGSGAVGRSALALLTQVPEYEIITFDIKSKASKAVYKDYLDRITLIYGDISNKKEIETACHNIDCAIHLAAIIPPLADEKPDLAYQVNTIGTRNLVEGLEKHSPEAFLLYSSSVSVYGDRLDDYWIKVSDPIQPSLGDEYGVTKVKAEKIIQSSQLNWSIFRLSAIIGIGNHKITGLMFHMPVKTKMEVTTPMDTARAFVNAIPKQKELNRRVFNLGSGTNFRLTFEMFLEKNFQIMGLGAVDFPPKSFAEKNFHCGYYEDSDDLEAIVHFRNETLESHFLKLKDSVSIPQRLATRLLSFFIKKYLTTLSEPLKAFKNNDKPLIHRFFK